MHLRELEDHHAQALRDGAAAKSDGDRQYYADLAAFFARRIREEQQRPA